MVKSKKANRQARKNPKHPDQTPPRSPNQTPAAGDSLVDEAALDEETTADGVFDDTPDESTLGQTTPDELPDDECAAKELVLEDHSLEQPDIHDPGPEEPDTSDSEPEELDTQDLGPEEPNTPDPSPEQIGSPGPSPEEVDTLDLRPERIGSPDPSPEEVDTLDPNPEQTGSHDLSLEAPDTLDLGPSDSSCNDPTISDLPALPISLPSSPSLSASDIYQPPPASAVPFEARSLTPQSPIGLTPAPKPGDQQDTLKEVHSDQEDSSGDEDAIAATAKNYLSPRFDRALTPELRSPNLPLAPPINRGYADPYTPPYYLTGSPPPAQYQQSGSPQPHYQDAAQYPNPVSPLPGYQPSGSFFPPPGTAVPYYPMPHHTGSEVLMHRQPHDFGPPYHGGFQNFAPQFPLTPIRNQFHRQDSGNSRRSRPSLSQESPGTGYGDEYHGRGEFFGSPGGGEGKRKGDPMMAAMAEDDVGDLLQRTMRTMASISAGIPDLNRMLNHYKKTNHQLQEREALLRKVEMQQNEALRQKEQHIDHLTKQLDIQSNRHSAESNKLRLEIGNVEEKHREITESLDVTQKAKEELEEAKGALELEKEELEKKFTEERQNFYNAFEKYKEESKAAFEEEKSKMEESFMQQKHAMEEAFAEEKRVLGENFEQERREIGEAFEAEKRYMGESFDAEKATMEEEFAAQKKSMEESFEAEKASMGDRFEEEKTSMNQNFEEEKTSMGRAFDVEKASMGEAFGAEKATMVENFETEKTSMRETFAAEKKDMDDKFETEKKTMEDTFEAEKNDMEQKFEAEKKAMISAMEEEKRKMDEAFEERRQERETAFENEKNAILDSFEKEKESMNAAFAQQKQDMEDNFARMQAELEERLNARHRELEDAVAKEREEWAKEREELVRGWDEERTGMNNRFEEQRNAMIEQHQREKDEMQAAWDAVKAEMIRRSDEERGALEREKDVLRRGWEADKARFGEAMAELKGVHENLGAEKTRLQKMVDKFGEWEEIKSKGDPFYLDSFRILAKEIIDLSHEHFQNLPIAPPAEVLKTIPSNLPSFIGNTDSSRAIRAAYVTHIISNTLCYRVFGPFLFSLGRRYDKADSLFQAMSNELRQKSHRREAMWRQQTLYAAYTASSAKKATNATAGAVVEEIVSQIKPFADPRRKELITIAVTRIVKRAAETWRYARLEREMISARMPAAEDVADDEDAEWPAETYEGKEFPKGTLSGDIGPRRVLLRLLPIISREPIHEVFQTDVNEPDNGCTYLSGLALYSDATPVVGRHHELNSKSLNSSHPDAPLPPPEQGAYSSRRTSIDQVRRKLKEDRESRSRSRSPQDQF